MLGQNVTNSARSFEVSQVLLQALHGFLWGLSASVGRSEITRYRTEVVLIVIFADKKMFLSAEVNPCHFASYSS